MIIYLAGQATEVLKMPHNERWEHVLISFGCFQKKVFKILQQRKRNERKKKK